jgi:hypothetical protein
MFEVSAVVNKQNILLDVKSANKRIKNVNRQKSKKLVNFGRSCLHV